MLGQQAISKHLENKQTKPPNYDIMSKALSLSLQLQATLNNISLVSILGAMTEFL